MSNVVKIVFFNNFALEVTLTRNRFMRTLQPTIYLRVLGFVGDISSSYDEVWRLLARWKYERKKRALLRRSEATKRRFGKGREYTTSHKCIFLDLLDVSLGFFVLVPIGIIRPFYTIWSDQIFWISEILIRYSGFFLLSVVTRFACDIGQLAKIWIWVSSKVITVCI